MTMFDSVHCNIIFRKNIFYLFADQNASKRTLNSTYIRYKRECIEKQRNLRRQHASDYTHASRAIILTNFGPHMRAHNKHNVYIQLLQNKMNK